MYSITVKISGVDEAKEFVKRASECSFDVDLCYNKVVIDAKSILGVMSLDLRKILTVNMNGRDEAFESYLDKLHEAALEAA